MVAPSFHASLPPVLVLSPETIFLTEPYSRWLLLWPALHCRQQRPSGKFGVELARSETVPLLSQRSGHASLIDDDAMDEFQISQAIPHPPELVKVRHFNELLVHKLQNLFENTTSLSRKSRSSTYAEGSAILSSFPAPCRATRSRIPNIRSFLREWIVNFEGRHSNWSPS